MIYPKPTKPIKKAKDAVNKAYSKRLTKKERIEAIRMLSPIRKTKVKKIKLSTYKDRAWKACSEYTRRKYADQEGYEQCYTCPTRKPWKQMQAGHCISGRNNAVLFDERIIRPQDVGCNIFGRGQYQIFAYKLIKELGLGVYEGILFEAQKPVKYTALDYQEKERYFKEKLESLNG